MAIVEIATRAGGAMVATSGRVKLAACGDTTSCDVRWHVCIAGWPEGSALWSGQWHFAGSGQQQLATTVKVRSCDVGTARAVTIASRIRTATIDVYA